MQQQDTKDKGFNAISYHAGKTAQQRGIAENGYDRSIGNYGGHNRIWNGD